jgi:hypothetical protein
MLTPATAVMGALPVRLPPPAMLMPRSADRSGSACGRPQPAQNRPFTKSPRLSV